MRRRGSEEVFTGDGDYVSSLADFRSHPTLKVEIPPLVFDKFPVTSSICYH